MSKQPYAVLIVHGISANDPTAGPRRLMRNVRRLLHGVDGFDDSVEVYTELVQWWKPVQVLQDKVYNSCEKHLGYPKLRKLFTGLLGDAVAYQPGPPSMANDPSLYQVVSDEVTTGLLSLRDRAGDAAPLMIIAHSLGTVIASNYIWDVMNYRFPPVLNGASDLAYLKTLKTFITMGSPLATWSVRYAGGGSPVEVPSWVNLYNHYDVISSLLGPINEAYRQRVLDIHAEIGGLWAWTPATHCGYWGSRHVAQVIADEILDDMEF